MTRNEQIAEIKKLNQQLPIRLAYSTSRNYLDGSVFVERGRNIIGICLDSVDPYLLPDLKFDPSKLPHLQDVVIRNTSVLEFPEWFYEFNQIENLVLKSLDLENISHIIQELPQLKFLAVPNNSLTHIENIEILEHLYRLNLNKNKLEKLPQGIEELEFLISMTINENYLKNNGTSLSSKQLQAVSLQNNQLHEVPDLVKDQDKLHHLDLSSNFIEDLPDWMTHLRSLEYLYLSHNKLSKLPEFLQTLDKLRYLKLDHNPQISIDTSILYNMENLLELDITNIEDNERIIDKLLAFQKMSDTSFKLNY